MAVCEYDRMAWKRRYWAMIHDFAESVWRAYMNNPCQQFWWFYTESQDGVWGEFCWDMDNPDERTGKPWELARPEPIPRSMTVDQLEGWLEQVAGSLPIIGV